MPAQSSVTSPVASLPVGGALALAGTLQRSFATATATATAAAAAAAAATASATRTAPAPTAAAAAAPARSQSGRHGGSAMPAPAPPSAAAPGVQRRSESPSQQSWVSDRGVPAPIPDLAGSRGESSATHPAPAARSATDRGDDLEHLVEQVVEALEDRVLGELERRGGRFLGAF